MAYIPSAPNSPTGYDEIRTSNGSSCRSSVGGNVQIYAGGYSNKGDSGNYYSSGDETGVHVGVAYSFGAGERIDCSDLQRIETEKARLELEKLRAEIDGLKQLRELQLLQSRKKTPTLVSK